VAARPCSPVAAARAPGPGFAHRTDRRVTTPSSKRSSERRPIRSPFERTGLPWWSTWRTARRRAHS
jgi:hypothetical protein